MGGLKLYVHLTVASLIVFLMHIITPVVVLNTVGRLFGDDLWFQLTPILSILAGYGASRFYLKSFRVERPGRRALVATITGTVLFWGSCLAFVCSLANLPTGW